MRRARTLSRSLVAFLTCALAVTGCEFQGVQQIPLPGGVDVGSDANEVKIEFADVLDLVPQSSVKVNDVGVGRVEDVELDGWHAVVTVKLRRDVRLPDNAVARLRQTSLLGEKFVSLSPPEDESPRGRLSDGDLIPLDRSGRNPEVEEVLSALSLLLNGGGVDQLQTINRELTAVMAGREDRVKSVLRQLDTFVGDLDANKAEIVRAIEGLDKLSARLADERGTLEVALDDIPPGLAVLSDQRRELTEMLQALSDLGEVGTRVIRQSKSDTVADLQALVPILDKLGQAGRDLPRALEMIATYPFPSTVGNAVRGDYTNLRVTADLDLSTIFSNLDVPPGQQQPEPPKAPVPDVPKLPDVPKPDDLVDQLCADIPSSTPLPPVCEKQKKLGQDVLPQVVTGLCSLVPEKDRPDVCPDKPTDKDADGKVDVCVTGVICTDKDAPPPPEGSDGSGGSGGSGGADNPLCPPLCTDSSGVNLGLARLLVGGLG